MTFENGRSENMLSGDEDMAGLGRVAELLRQDATWAVPPAGVESSILLSITGEPSPPAVDPEPVRRRSRLVPVMVGALAVAVVAFIVLGPATELATEPATVFALSGTDRAATLEGTATVRPTDSGWYIHIDVSGLPPAPEGTYYEGWVLDDGNAVSIGTFHMRGGDDAVVLWSGVSLADYPDLSVTLQEEGGGFAPSDAVMLTGRVEGSESGQ